MWRKDKRPWCSLDEIFQGRFVFCDETEEEQAERERAIEAERLFIEGVRKMNGYDTRKSLIKEGYDMALQERELHS